MIQFRRTAKVRLEPRLEPELDATRGRVGEAIDHLRVIRDDALGRGEIGPAVETALAIGRLSLATGNPAGTREVEDFLTRTPLDSLDALSRPMLPLVMFYADAGLPNKARAAFADYERLMPAQFQGPNRWMEHRARAAVYRAEGKLDQALAEMRVATRYPPIRVGLFDDIFIRPVDHPELARLYDSLGNTDSAIVVFERYIAARSLNRTTMDAFELGHALERLGTLHEQRGDTARATAYYDRLATLWKGADKPFEQRAVAASRHVRQRARMTASGGFE